MEFVGVLVGVWVVVEVVFGVVAVGFVVVGGGRVVELFVGVWFVVLRLAMDSGVGWRSVLGVLGVKGVAVAVKLDAELVMA
ncbi:hypothetical protein, partial [Pseudomonas syringae group genomosp. 7]|uniref:hypothetical protein n=1 Tax=Pseudomonas syringae group genomosp. 7 TaxID=251699 RepID=UPI003770014A